MSNEYKSWIEDSARDYLLKNESIINRIEYTTIFNDGYIIICKLIDFSKGLYFVWFDDIDGWSYKEVII